MSNICPHCGGELRQAAVPRAEKAKQLANFYSEQFITKDVVSAEKPAPLLASICKQALEKGLTSKKTSRGDRVSSLLRHLHAFAENQKPYGPKSRKAGEHWTWMNRKYGNAACICTEVESLLKGK